MGKSWSIKNPDVSNPTAACPLLLLLVPNFSHCDVSFAGNDVKRLVVGQAMSIVTWSLVTVEYGMTWLKWTT